MSIEYQEALSLIEDAIKREATELDLSGIGLSKLPPKIAKLWNLEALYLVNNELKILPPEIGQLTQLEELYLGNNLLTALPPEIGQLTELRELYIEDNLLTNLPPEIGQLTQLKEIHLGNNQLTTLPLEISKLTNLAWVGLSNNQLKFPPPEIIKQGVKAIKEYLRTFKVKNRGKKVYEAKLIVVGQGGVGKTCICNRLIEDQYCDEEKTTEGIAIKNWGIKSPDKAKTDIRMNVWDFGGQEIYHATHQFFLTRRAVYLLVWDARQEDKFGLLDHWLYVIETFGEDSPVILVMNKCDERVQDINLRDLKERFPQIKEFYKVSCKEPEIGRNSFAELKQEISRAAWELPLMGSEWIKSWLSVREALEADNRNQIDYTEYQKICEQHSVLKGQKDILSEYLHDLGVVLHFKNDELLKHTMILKPEWGTGAVYKVLDTPAVQERGGILLESDLADIWKDREGYPQRMHLPLLRLMSNFELAFQMPGTHNYIVAERLPKEPVDFTWDYNGNLQFQYQYSFMPAGIVPRFIVRTHEDLERRKGKYLCWKEGAILSRDGTSGFVRAIPGERRIEIRVNGDKKGDLLAIIRRELDNINSRFHRIKIIRAIPCICSTDCKKLFDYDRLCKMEGTGETEDFCEQKGTMVSIKKMLDGLETSKERKDRYGDTIYAGGDIIMGDKYQAKGQIGHMGSAHAKRDIIYQQQMQTGIDFDLLAKELPTLIKALKEKASETEDYIVIGAVAEAQKALEEKDSSRVMAHLKKAGKWAFDAATGIGASVAAAAISKAIGI